MYTTTFYSFKGGVGRTMALVNVAVEFANRGQKVLALDFDLEAPGLDTFDLGRPPRPTPGILDFVHDYLNTGRSPDVREYVFKAADDIGKDGGELWIMPSGSQDGRYSQRLASLDWNHLYEHYEGHLLMEDLKAQWDKDMGIDYALVDSRTGYTDVGGICTRHIPDAVVLLFLPNEQNIRGLRRIVPTIRAEKKPPREKNIHLHFVASNVPDLDDEEEILEGILRSARRALQIDEAPLLVHRYQSLSLLNQVIFCRDRPRTRLAKEYRALGLAVAQNNVDDPVGMLERLREQSPWRNKDWLDRIEDAHPENGPILHALWNQRKRLSGEAPVELLDRAIASSPGSPLVYLERAQALRGENPATAATDALRALEAGRLPVWRVAEAIRLLGEDQIPAALESTAIKTLTSTERHFLASSFRPRLSLPP